MKWLTVILIFISISVKAPERDFNFEQICKGKLIKEYKGKAERLLYLECSNFTESNFKKYLKLKEIPYCEMAIRIAKLETSNFTSKLFKNNNNLFGMHYPYSRKNCADYYVIADKGRRVSGYSHWTRSVNDFILRTEYFENKGYCIKNFEKFLVDTRYCEKGSYYLVLLKAVKI